MRAKAICFVVVAWLLMVAALSCAADWSGQDTSSGVHGQLVFEPASFSGAYTQSFCDNLVTSTWAARYGFIWSGRCLPGQVNDPGRVTTQNPGIVNGTYYVSYSFPTATWTQPSCTLTTSGVNATCTGHGMLAGDWVWVGGSINEYRLIYSITDANNFVLDQAFPSNPNTSSVWRVHHAELRANPEWILYRPDQKQPVDIFNNGTFIKDPALTAVRSNKVSQISGAAVAALDNAFFSPPGAGCSPSICGPKGRWSTGYATTGSFTNLYDGEVCNDDCDLVFTDAVIGFFQYLKDNAKSTMIIPNGDIRFITEKNATCGVLPECYDTTRVAALKSAIHGMFIEGSEFVTPYADRDARATWLRNLKLIEDLQTAPNAVAVLSNAYFYNICPASGSVDCVLDSSKETTHAITVASTAGNYVEISGDHRTRIGIGHRLVLTGANAGTFIVDVPPALVSGNTRVTFASVTPLASNTANGTLTTGLYGIGQNSNQPPAMIQWILGSYLLSNKGKSYLSLPARGWSNATGQHGTATPGAYNFYSQWWPEFTAVGTGAGAPLGTACSARAKVGGGTTEKGAWAREFTGGYVVLNADRTNTVSNHAFPTGAWSYVDLYGASAGASTNLPPLGAKIVLKQGATGCSGATYTLTINSSSPSSGVAVTLSPADNNSVASCNTGSCVLTYNTGAVVTVTVPASASGNIFASFSGCDSAASNVCTQTLAGNETITANYALPAACANEPSLAGRADILKCEGWESNTWWSNSGWYRDQGDTGSALDGRRFHRFPVDAQWMNDITKTEVVTSGCLVGSCLKVNMLGWQQGIGSYMAMNWIIPGQGGCSHDTLGCVPQQEVYMRYYMKLAPNYEPANAAFGTGGHVEGGGKLPGLSDAINGWAGNPAAIQCGNGGEGPTLGTECWSLRLTWQTCNVTDNGTQETCQQGRNYKAKTRFGWYPYLYWNGNTGGTRSATVYWDNDARGTSLPGACNTTYGFSGGLTTTGSIAPACGSGAPGLVNNKWYMVEVRVKMNTPGIDDGIMEAWLDGELRYSKNNVRFRNVGHNNLGVRAAWFDVYAGGIGVGMKEDTYILFDQLVIATGARPGPNSAQQRGNMVTVTADPSGGMDGFSRGHYYEDVNGQNGGYLTLFGAGSVNSGDNSIRLQRLDQSVSGTPGMWYTPFASDNSANIQSRGKHDNFLSLFIPWERALLMSGGSYLEPGAQQGADKTISGWLSFANCTGAFTTGCARWTQLSRWTAANTAQNWNAAFTGGAGSECPFGPCVSLVKNAAFFESWRTDNAAACNIFIRICMHGWGFNNNGQHWVLEENVSNSICNPAAASGAEKLIHCELPSNPKNVPYFSDNNNTSDQPAGSGTTPGWRSQAMNVLVQGPDHERCFFLTGTFAAGPVNIRDLWRYNCRAKSWTQLTAPPAVSYTSLMVYDSVRNQLLLQANDKIYSYPLFGANTWYDVTPAAGIGIAVFNAYGAFIENAELMTFQDGNRTDNAGPAKMLRAFSMNTAAVQSSPVLSFAAATSSGSESTTTVLIPVSLANHPGTTVTVNYAATGGSATGGGVDYTLTSGTLTFPNGTVTQNVPLTVINDGAQEGPETVQITLSSPTSGVSLGTAEHSYTIIDDDSGTVPEAKNAPGYVGAGATIGAGAIVGGAY